MCLVLRNVLFEFSVTLAYKMSAIRLKLSLDWSFLFYKSYSMINLTFSESLMYFALWSSKSLFMASMNLP